MIHNTVFAKQNVVVVVCKGRGKTLFVMAQGLIQTLLVRLPMAYFMSIQPNASLTNIGLAAPTSTVVGVCLSIGCYLYMNRSRARQQA